MFNRAANLSSVMPGLVPSICNVSIFNALADPRHKAEDDDSGWSGVKGSGVPELSRLDY